MMPGLSILLAFFGDIGSSECSWKFQKSRRNKGGEMEGHIERRVDGGVLCSMVPSMQGYAKGVE